MKNESRFDQIKDAFSSHKAAPPSGNPNETSGGKARFIAEVSVLTFFVAWYLLNVLKNIIVQYHAFKAAGQNVLLKSPDLGLAMKAGLHFIRNTINPKYLPILAVASVVFAVAVSKKKKFISKHKVAYGQKGDERFTTIKELKHQYPMIPDHDTPDNKPSFEGYGGVPISHIYKKRVTRKGIQKDGYYFIDRSTSHNIVIGTSRSGKGQTMVLPMLDILSRAGHQSSLVVNDPKGELYTAASKTLHKRGYKVYLLNLDDGSQSMAYNPLQPIVDKWLLGDQEGAMDLVNALTYTLYHDEHAGANRWVYDDAQNAVNGMIIALLEYCAKTDQLEKVTLNNIVDMINELGNVYYQPNPKDPFTKVNLLDEYFSHLKQGSTAKSEYMATSFSGEKAKGSIFSTVNQGLEIFKSPKMARMTSMNSLALKSVGFPKYMNFKLGKKFQGKRVKIVFVSRNNKIKSHYIVRVNFGGFVQYNFGTNLKTGDYLIIKYSDREQKQKLVASYRLTIPKKSDDVKADLIKDNLGVTKLDIKYSDRPTAIFMKIPDYKESNNILASIFIAQLYSELASQCGYVEGGKTIKRVQFILDEFGNMKPIKSMDQIMTVSAGRNILFTLVIQSYQQLFAKYGREKGQTIKENGQNQILIKTTDENTLKEFSSQIGHKTVESRSVSKGNGNSTSVSAESIPLLTPERIKDMEIGESIVLRPLYRQDLSHKSVRPYPIFNTGPTKMPYAYSFLSDEFDPDKNPNLLDIDVPHANLDLSSLRINWRDWISSPQALKAFDDFKEKNAASISSMGAIDDQEDDYSDDPEAADQMFDDQERITDEQLAELQKDNENADTARDLESSMLELGHRYHKELAKIVDWDTFASLVNQGRYQDIFNLITKSAPLGMMADFDKLLDRYHIEHIKK